MSFDTSTRPLVHKLGTQDEPVWIGECRFVVATRIDRKSLPHPYRDFLRSRLIANAQCDAALGRLIRIPNWLNNVGRDLMLRGAHSFRGLRQRRYYPFNTIAS